MTEHDKDQPLREDIARLDRLLGEVIAEQEGPAVAMRLANLRHADGTPDACRRSKTAKGSRPSPGTCCRKSPPLRCSTERLFTIRKTRTTRTT